MRHDARRFVQLQRNVQILREVIERAAGQHAHRLAGTGHHRCDRADCSIAPRRRQHVNRFFSSLRLGDDALAVNGAHLSFDSRLRERIAHLRFAIGRFFLTSRSGSTVEQCKDPHVRRMLVDSCGMELRQQIEKS